MMGHNASQMIYDSRYAPFFRRLGVLGFVLQFKRVPPKFNSTVLSALVDRWRPKTHSFHLPCGEMTVTLQDFAMITGLPIDGEALTGVVDPNGWRQRVTNLIGVCSPAPEERVKDPRPSGVLYTWLRANRNGCPPDADEATVE